jgi:hypothetical protein
VRLLRRPADEVSPAVQDKDDCDRERKFPCNVLGAIAREPPPVLGGSVHRAGSRPQGLGSIPRAAAVCHDTFKRRAMPLPSEAAVAPVPVHAEDKRTRGLGSGAVHVVHAGDRDEAGEFMRRKDVRVALV